MSDFTPASSIRHLGIILDGNRRWARAQGLPVIEGHRKGSEVFKVVALAAFDKGIQYVSAFVFSTENWKRPEEEVSYLMKLVIKATEKYLNEFHEAGIRIVILGSRQGLSKVILDSIKKTEETTRDNKRGTLALCFNYGGRQEIVDAARLVIEKGIKQDDLTQESFEQFLYSSDIPSIDLVVRTSGEQRISGFMLWRAAYAELAFVEKHWPDFTISDLDEVIEDFNKRQRRFGK